MTEAEWNRIKSVSAKDVIALCESEEHSDNRDCLAVDFQHVTSGGKQIGDWLLNVYYLAQKNVTDNAVTSFLCSIDDSGDLKALSGRIFLDIAARQKKKTFFEKLIDSELSRRRKEKRKAERERQLEERRAFLAAQPDYYGKKLTQEVVETMLCEEGQSVRLNLVTKRIELHGNTEVIYEQYSRDNIMSTLPTILLDKCKNNEVGGSQGVSLGSINAYLFNLADANRYNPIRDMLIQNENEDAERLDMVYEILGLNNDFDKTLVKKWLIQTVAFAFADLDNPVSAEGLLVLQGEQGNGKTSFFRKLAGNPLWFTEGAVIDTRNKDTLITAIGSWICELGEIDCTLRKEQSALKAFITRTVDKIRLPYAPSESEMPRTTSMCGTVNPEQFLKDSTGNRRYWTVHVDRIDKRRLHALTQNEIFRMWGYVYHLYLQDKEGFRLNDVEFEMLGVRNRDYSTGLPFEEEVRALLDFEKLGEFWRWTSPAELTSYIQYAKAENIGRVLAKISTEDNRVKMRRVSNGKQYLIPLDSWINQQLKSRVV